MNKNTEKKSPKNREKLIQSLLNKSKKYIQEEKYEEALPHLKKLHKIARENPYKDYYLGRCYYKLNEEISSYGYLESCQYLDRAAMALHKIEYNSLYSLHAGESYLAAAMEKKQNFRVDLYHYAIEFFEAAILIDKFDKSSDKIMAFLYKVKANYGLANYEKCIDNMLITRLKLDLDFRINPNLKLCPIYQKLEEDWDIECEKLSEKGFEKIVCALKIKKNHELEELQTVEDTINISMILNTIVCDPYFRTQNENKSNIELVVSENSYENNTVSIN